MLIYFENIDETLFSFCFGTICGTTLRFVDFSQRVVSTVWYQTIKNRWKLFDYRMKLHLRVDKLTPCDVSWMTKQNLFVQGFPIRHFIILSTTINSLYNNFIAHNFNLSCFLFSAPLRQLYQPKRWWLKSSSTNRFSSFTRTAFKTNYKEKERRIRHHAKWQRVIFGQLEYS